MNDGAANQLDDHEESSAYLTCASNLDDYRPPSGKANKRTRKYRRHRQHGMPRDASDSSVASNQEQRKRPIPRKKKAEAPQRTCDMERQNVETTAV